MESYWTVFLESIDGSRTRRSVPLGFEDPFPQEGALFTPAWEEQAYLVVSVGRPDEPPREWLDEPERPTPFYGGKRRPDSGGTGGRYGLHLNKDPYWLDPEHAGMGSSLPSSERCKHDDASFEQGGIRAHAKSRRGAKRFTASRRRQGERKLLKSLLEEVP